MSNQYIPVQWNRQKRRYDRIMISLIGLYLVVFAVLQLWWFPQITPESLIIRATGTLAFLLLHIVLCIGPLSRLDPRFLPLLYNRRHLGVTLFLIALIHGIFNIIQYHALGNTDPLVSVFTANQHWDSVPRFPFQVLGFFALLILLLMAATSHDFWLKNLGPKTWKALHMLVYFAYLLLVGHVLLGIIQLEYSPGWIGLYACGVITVTGLHLAAGWKSPSSSAASPAQVLAGYYSVCGVDDIAENRATICQIDGQDIAIFRYENKLSAVSNRCRHQNGPLGEGKIVDGCITCPWHGYQYLPHNGQSPPPYQEKLETYDVQITAGQVYVNPTPYPPGTERPAANILS